MIYSKKVGLEIINLCLNTHTKTVLVIDSNLDPMYVS